MLECDYAVLPEDVLINIYMLLPACSLRAAAASNKVWYRALQQAPSPLHQRAAWLHHWTFAGAGARIWPVDSDVCAGDGSWTPCGVALATTLLLSRAQDSGFRLVVEDAAPGDLLMGITLHRPGVGDDGATPRLEELLQMGYHYMLGRRIDADGEIQTSPTPSSTQPGGGGGDAPRSIFYGGRSRRCCFATPTASASGPIIDMGHDGSSPGSLAKLRHVGDWVEFWLIAGSLRATDHNGKTHVWGMQVQDGEIWVPTLAWTGSRASIRLAPPTLAP